MQKQQDKISIIIPVLNEAVHILKVLNYLTENSSRENIEEIIVVDGGSTDGSQKIVSSFQDGVNLLITPKGRAIQMNKGALVAKGNILYFLHADSIPPKDFDKKVIKYIGNNSVGSFRLKFNNSSHYLLKMATWFTQFNFSLFRGGDQSLFIRKKDFLSLDGFDERYIIYEDIEFIKRVYNRFTFRIIPDYVITSDRKFRENGVCKLYFNFLMIHLKSWLRYSPEALYQYYVKSIRD